MGGSSETAARHATRLGDGFVPTTPALWEYYRNEAIRIGKPDPGEYLGGDTGVIHVAADIDEGWAELGPYALHEMNAYGTWMAGSGLAGIGGYEPIESLDTLKATGQYRVVSPAQLTDEINAAGPFSFTVLHPMVGGLPPDTAWKSLRLIETEVIPAIN